MGDEEDEAAVKGALSWPPELYIHGGAIALAAEDAVRQVGFHVCLRGGPPAQRSANSRGTASHSLGVALHSGSGGLEFVHV